jgi:hypothetical protein
MEVRCQDGDSAISEFARLFLQVDQALDGFPGSHFQVK